MDKTKILMVLGNTERGGTQAFILNLLKNIDLNRFQIDLTVNSDIGILILEMAASAMMCGSLDVRLICSKLNTLVE